MAYKWIRKDKIDIYFSDKYGTLGENNLPVLPEELKCEIKGRNEKIDILHSSENSQNWKAGVTTFLKRPEQKVWLFKEQIFPHPNMPILDKRSDTKWLPAQWVEFFESAMYERKILEMTITSLNRVVEVTVENFSPSVRAGEEVDTYYDLEIQEYNRTQILKEEIKIEQVIPKNGGGGIGIKAEEPVQGLETRVSGYLWKTFDKGNGLQVLVFDENDSNMVLKVDNLPIKILQIDETPISVWKLSPKGEEKYNEFFKNIASLSVDKAPYDAIKLLLSDAFRDSVDKEDVLKCFEIFIRKKFGITNIYIPIETVDDKKLFVLFFLTLATPKEAENIINSVKNVVKLRIEMGEMWANLIDVKLAIDCLKEYIKDKSINLTYNYLKIEGQAQVCNIENTVPFFETEDEYDGGYTKNGYKFPIGQKFWCYKSQILDNITPDIKYKAWYTQRDVAMEDINGYKYS